MEKERVFKNAQRRSLEHCVFLHFLKSRLTFGKFKMWTLNVTHTQSNKKRKITKPLGEWITSKRGTPGQFSQREHDFLRFGPSDSFKHTNKIVSSAHHRKIAQPKNPHGFFVFFFFFFFDVKHNSGRFNRWRSLFCIFPPAKWVFHSPFFHSKLFIFTRITINFTGIFLKFFMCLNPFSTFPFWAECFLFVFGVETK